MIKITLEYSTLEDAILALSNIRNPETAPKIVATDAKPKADKVTAGKSATTEKPADGKPAVEAGPKDAAEKKEPASSASATVDAYEPVGAMIKKLAATHRAQVLATLSEFGAANGKELKQEQYASFIEKLTAATSGELA